MDVKYIYIQSLLIKGLHKYSLDICELFWDVKMENGFFGKIQKILDTNGHAFKNTTGKTFFLIFPVKN